MMIRQYLRRVATFVMASLALSTAVVMKQAIASDYSTRPIQIIVPFAAGGGADTAVRILQNRLSQELNQPVVIQNLTGAAGIVGTEAIKKSNNDGLTIGISTGSTIGTGQIFSLNLPFNYVDDFEYVGVLGEIPRGLFVSKDSAYKSIKDVIADRQGDKSFGVPGQSPDQLNAAIFNSITKSNHQLIPYTVNTNTMILDLLGGRLHGVWQSLPAMNSCLQDQSCKLIAVTGESRHPNFKDVPTFKELGLKDVDAPSYYGFISPKNVSAVKLEILNRAINVALNDPVVVKKLQEVGVFPTPKNLKDSKTTHFRTVDLAKKAAPLLPQDKK